METNKTFKFNGEEFTLNVSGKHSSEYSFKVADLVQLVKDEAGAKDLIDELVRLAHELAIEDCEKQAKSGDLISTDTKVSALVLDDTRVLGYVEAGVRYSWAEDIAQTSVSVSVDSLLKEEEDEDCNEIPENVAYNEVLRSLEEGEFYEKMNEGYHDQFDELYERSKEDYCKLHPEDKEFNL